jgi:hypothetical protein
MPQKIENELIHLSFQNLPEEKSDEEGPKK